jgi:hypothetical protein
MSGSTATRPTGVTILAVLSAIGGVLGLLAGVALLGLGGIAAGATGQAAFFGLGALAGIITVAIAIGQLAFAYGAWSLQPWAWSLGMVLALASIVWSVLLAVTSGDIVNGLISQAISIAISGVIIYYLNTPNVKAAFGKTAA